MLLRSQFEMTWKEISPLVGVSASTLSRVANGKKKGGPQLLAGLNLLIELETLKRKPSVETMEQRIERLERELKAVQTGKYPAPKPEQMLNEDQTGGDANSSQDKQLDQSAVVSLTQEQKESYGAKKKKGPKQS